MGGFLCLRLNSGRFLTPLSSHNFPPTLEEQAEYTSQFLGGKFMDIMCPPHTLQLVFNCFTVGLVGSQWVGSEMEHTGNVFPVHPPSTLYCTLVAFGSLWPFSLRMREGLQETAVLHFANYKVANHASHPDKEKGLTFSYVCKGFQLATLTFFWSCQVCEFTCYQYTSHVPVVWSFMHPKRTHYI